MEFIRYVIEKEIDQCVCNKCGDKILVGETSFEQDNEDFLATFCLHCFLRILKNLFEDNSFDIHVKSGTQLEKKG